MRRFPPSVGFTKGLRAEAHCSSHECSFMRGGPKKEQGALIEGLPLQLAERKALLEVDFMKLVMNVPLCGEV